MVRKTRHKYKINKGGMMRTIARPVGKAAISLGENVGKDYLQKKSVKA